MTEDELTPAERDTLAIILACVAVLLLAVVVASPFIA